MVQYVCYLVVYTLSLQLANCASENIKEINTNENTSAIAFPDVNVDDLVSKNSLKWYPRLNTTVDKVIKPVFELPVENLLNVSNPKHENMKQIKQNMKQRSQDDFKPSQRDFRPSPQIDTHFEYNKNPVLPVIGEPRTNYKSYQLLNNQAVITPWKFPEKTNKENFKSNLDKKLSFSNDFSFPMQNTLAGESVDQPHRFYSNQNDGYQNEHVYHTRTTDNDQLNKHPYIEGASEFRESGKYGNLENSLHKRIPYSKEDIYEIKNYDEHGNIHGLQKTHYDDTHYSPQKSYPEYKYLFLKKAVKFLTAILPLGLLISALTPAIINVEPVNDTVTEAPNNMKRRTKKSGDIKDSTDLLDLLLVKLPPRQCEKRMICELIANSKLTEFGTSNIDELLKPFTKKERGLVNEMVEYEMVLKAAKSSSCETLPCSI